MLREKRRMGRAASTAISPANLGHYAHSINGPWIETRLTHFSLYPANIKNKKGGITFYFYWILFLLNHYTLHITSSYLSMSPLLSSLLSQPPYMSPTERLEPAGPCSGYIAAPTDLRPYSMPPGAPHCSPPPPSNWPNMLFGTQDCSFLLW